MRIIILSLLLTACWLSNLQTEIFAQDEAQKMARAHELITQARAALGAEKLTSLSVTGTYRQLMGEREVAGELQVDFLLPDKYLKTTTMSPIQGLEVTRMEALNGEKAWVDMQNSGGGGGGNIVFRAGPGPGGGPNASATDMQKAQQIFVSQDATRVLLGMILQAPAAMQLEFRYAGAAEAEDGKADMIEVKGANGFAAQLFLDQKTHYPLMLSYKGRKPRMSVVTHQISGDAAKKMTPEEIAKKAQGEESKNDAIMKAQQEPLSEIQIRFMDFSAEGGVKLPHRVSRAIDGGITEEWELTKFKINPTIKPDNFEKK